MCNEYFDSKDLENLVNPCSETPSSGGGNENPGNENENGNGDNSGNGGCSSDLGANNNIGGNSCPSHKGHIEPQPNWGVGGLSIDNPEENN